ncbi:MAG: exopolysaccharide biosynthesis protein [Bacteroidetes bacterium]|nr:exopolysaccharide biosynthesis protein [Bacteroidota bacterium]
MSGNPHFSPPQFTLREVVKNLIYWVKFFRSKWKLLVLFLSIGAGLGAGFSQVKDPVFHAETSFVLEEEGMSGIGQMSGIANLLGVNLGGIGTNGLFQGDNIMELYRSDRMLEETLLSPFENDGLLIERFIESEDLEEKWASTIDLSALSFSASRENQGVKQDSVIKEISKIIREKQLVVVKPDRKLSIIQVTVSSKDEAFAKLFNETLVSKVNTFYLETKTKKTGENLRILQIQADSVRVILDQSMGTLAVEQDRIPNANPLLSAATVNSRRKQIDVQSSASVYMEIVKNLEMAKISHRINTPLIQLIDSPKLPLKRTEIRLMKGMVYGAFFLGGLALSLLYLRKLYQKHLQEV